MSRLYSRASKGISPSANIRFETLSRLYSRASKGISPSAKRGFETLSRLYLRTFEDTISSANRGFKSLSMLYSSCIQWLPRAKAHQSQQRLRIIVEAVFKVFQVFQSCWFNVSPASATLAACNSFQGR